MAGDADRLARANALIDAGRLDQGAAILADLLRKRPADPAANTMMCFVWARRGEHERALYCARRAHAADPGDGNVVSNLGNALMDTGRLDEAVALLRAALAAMPGHAGVAATGTFALSRAGLHHEAIEAADRSLVHDPNLATVLANKAFATLNSGRPEEALAAWARALELAPDNGLFLSGAAGASNYAELPMSEVLARHVAAGALYRRLLGPPADRWGVAPDPDRALRVGLLSPDFRDHAVAAFAEPFIEHHDRAAVSLTLYSTATVHDRVSDRLAGRVGAGAFRRVAALSPHDLAATIRADRTDVLIDLAGHTAGHRLPVMHLRPAPVQMTWIGYPATTGVAAVGHRIVDGVTDPAPAAEAHMVERPLRLDPCFTCFRPRDGAPEPAPPPRSRGEPFTFGSFGAMPKFGAATLRLYAAAVDAVEGSRLFIKNNGLGSERARADLGARLAAAGVAPERLRIEPPGASTDEMLASYARVDVSLDTFPYHGTTTTCESLWMGVPMVTLLGDRHAARVGASLLRAVGLGELVAATEAEYAAVAARLAGDPDLLARWRSAGPEGIRAMMARSALCDGPGFSRRLEGALRGVWREWCGTQNPNQERSRD